MVCQFWVWVSNILEGIYFALIPLTFAWKHIWSSLLENERCVVQSQVPTYPHQPPVMLVNPANLSHFPQLSDER